jgi:A/G-specific adenine glycosylase
LAWYDRHHRDLPWRHTQDPYAIFISEMMLQQTQVKTVLPYYKRWMGSLPTWQALDRAPLDRVLKLWEGLGYYRRARNLKAAARMVLKDFHGKLPDTEEQILRLPGVGPYSAGAILSIAYQHPIPVVDGNVIRVFARLFAIPGDLKTGKRHQKIWELAKDLLSHPRLGDFNQALMEWGATLCLPTNPHCSVCPWATRCRAKCLGRTAHYPTPSNKPSTQTVFMAAALVRKDGKILLRKRPEGSRWWKGLWEFPSAEGSTHLEAVRQLEKELGLSLEINSAAKIQHQITNHRIEIRLHRAPWPVRRKAPFDYRWVGPKDWNLYALPSAHIKLRRLAIQ